MRVDTLLSPGILSQGFLLRKTAAQAISSIEITAKVTPGGKTAAAARLSAFFSDCVTKLATYVEVVLATVTTRVRTAVNTATITFTEELQPSTSVPLTSVVFSPVRTVTAITVTGSTMVITATGVVATDTITYTPPVPAIQSAGNPVLQSLGARDLAGNLVATFTGVLA